MAELDSTPKSIQSIYSWYSQDKLFVNRRYQRKLVWTQVEKQKLVESVLSKYPVPAILLAEREGGSYEIIDGLQRLHTLVSFIEWAFPTLEGNYFNVAQFPTAQAQLDAGAFLEVDVSNGALSAHEVTTYLDYSLAISVMRGASEEEIDDVFGRINTFGHRLSDQERRQAGVQDKFSSLVRDVACEIRGDPSSEIINLVKMPAISVDLPKTKHGYDVVAEKVFWVEQGILRSTDLRDSMDEQCLADVLASIVEGGMIERSKEALDRLYASDDDENIRVLAALDAYGADRAAGEVKFCVDELLSICNAGGDTKLRNIIFKRKGASGTSGGVGSTNPFPSVFAVLLVALHQCLIQDSQKVVDYEGAKAALVGVYERLETGRGSTAKAERQKNVNAIKGLLKPYLVESAPRDVYSPHSTTDIETIIRRSNTELAHYELKQGLLTLDANRTVEQETIDKVIRTLCAIGNNGLSHAGAVLIGVADRPAHAERVKVLDKIDAREIATRHVGGVQREAAKLGETTEVYVARWKNAIKNSGLSNPLRDDVLSNMDYHDFYGYGVVVFKIPPQKDLSTLDGKTYYRVGDETWEATAIEKIVELAKRFS